MTQSATFAATARRRPIHAGPAAPGWININLNYEAGGEHSLLEGDFASEGMLNDIGFPAYEGVRSPIVKSAFEYGSRCGVWRMLRIFARFGIPVSILAVRARARAQSGGGARHGRGRPRDREPRLSLDRLSPGSRGDRARPHRQGGGRAHPTDRQPPLGWYDRTPGPNTRGLLAEYGGFLDEPLPGRRTALLGGGRREPYLVVPYSFETNDNRFNENHGVHKAYDFFAYLKDGFDLLYEEGADQPKLMSIAIHDRPIGRPARAVGLIRFLDYVKGSRRSGSAAASMSPATGASTFRRRAPSGHSWRGSCCVLHQVQTVAQNERDMGG